MPKVTRIYRTEAGVVVEIERGSDVSGLIDIECMNPQDLPPERYYQRIFRRKPIFLAGEYQEAMAKYLTHPDQIVLSMNGYSTLKPDDLRRYGMKKGAYEQACAAVLRTAIEKLRRKFRGAKIQLVFGASDLGVDQAIEIVAREYNILPLGFSCPEFILYVKDDEIPVYIAADRDLYADYYVRSLDLLLTTGGREQALKHDITASVRYNKRIHFIDLPALLSNNGGIPATVIDADGHTKIENAAAAFGRNISFFSAKAASNEQPKNGDVWDAVFTNVEQVATEVCRRLMSPARMFQ
jgi:hypothetical protein